MYVYTVAARHLKTRSISWVAIAMIAAVVVLYLLIISVLEGFKFHYMDTLQSTLPHTTIGIGYWAAGIPEPERWSNEIATVDSGIKGVTASIETPAMALFDHARTIGTLRGIDMSAELQHGQLQSMLFPRDLKAFGTHEQGGKQLPGCIVGGAWRTQYNLSIGGRVTFLFTDENDEPRSVALAVIGFYEGKNPYLEQGAYCDRAFLASKLGVDGKAKTLCVWLNDPNRPDLPALKAKLQDATRALIDKSYAEPDEVKPLLTVETWPEKDNKIFDAIQQENMMMRCIMTIFLALIGFIIFLIFGRLVAEKVRDIGALRAMGATPAGIRWCFLMQGVLIGTIGLVAGLICSYFLISNINGISQLINFNPFPKASFGVDRIPHVTLPQDIVLIGVLTLKAAVLGALWPAYRASLYNPVECLRHE